MYSKEVLCVCNSKEIFFKFKIPFILDRLQLTYTTHRKITDGLLRYMNHWTCKRSNLVLQNWFTRPDSFLFYLLWAPCLWSGTLALASWAHSLEYSSDHPCNCGSHRVRGRNPTCGCQTSCQRMTASGQSPRRGYPAPAKWQWDAFRLMLQTNYCRILLAKTYLSKDDYCGPSDVWARGGKFLHQKLAIKPQLHHSGFGIPRCTDRVPRIGLVVQTSVFWLFILDVGLQLLVGFIPEHQQTIGIGGGGHGEKDVISFQVREGPAGITQVIISTAHTQNGNASLIFHHVYLWQTVTLLKSSRDGVSFTWAVLVSFGNTNILPDRSTKKKKERKKNVEA